MPPVLGLLPLLLALNPSLGDADELVASLKIAGAVVGVGMVMVIVVVWC